MHKLHSAIASADATQLRSAIAIGLQAKVDATLIQQAEAALTWQSPDETNRFQADQHQQFINWAKSLR